MSEEKTIIIDLIQAHAINLKEGDVLMVTVKSDEISEYTMGQLQKQLIGLFPNNRVMVFGMGISDDVKFTVASKDEVGYPDTSDEETKVLETVGECND